MPRNRTGPRLADQRRDCLHCRAPFTPVTATQRYCTPDCGRRVAAERSRERQHTRAYRDAQRVRQGSHHVGGLAAVFAPSRRRSARPILLPPALLAECKALFDAALARDAARQSRPGRPRTPVVPRWSPTR